MKVACFYVMARECLSLGVTTSEQVYDAEQLNRLSHVRMCVSHVHMFANVNISSNYFSIYCIKSNL